MYPPIHHISSQNHLSSDFILDKSNFPDDSFAPGLLNPGDLLLENSCHSPSATPSPTSSYHPLSYPVSFDSSLQWSQLPSLQYDAPLSTDIPPISLPHMPYVSFRLRNTGLKISPRETVNGGVAKFCASRTSHHNPYPTHDQSWSSLDSKGLEYSASRSTIPTISDFSLQQSLGRPTTPSSRVSRSPASLRSISPSAPSVTVTGQNISQHRSGISHLLVSRRPLHPPGTVQPKGRGFRGPHRTPAMDPTKALPCDRCAARFARKHDLDRHKRIHTLEAPYTCRGCMRGYRRSDARKRHWDQDPECYNVHLAQNEMDGL